MEVVEEGRGPKVQESQGLCVQRSKGPEDQDISNSNSNTSLTLKKVHLVHRMKLHGVGEELYSICNSTCK